MRFEFLLVLFVVGDDEDVVVVECLGGYLVF